MKNKITQFINSFQPEIKKHKVNIRSLNFKGIELDVTLSVINNFIFPLTIKGLEGSVYILKDDDSSNKLCDVELKIPVKIKSKSEEYISISTFIKYNSILFNLIPNLLNLHLYADINASVKCCFLSITKNVKMDL